MRPSRHFFLLIWLCALLLAAGSFLCYAAQPPDTSRNNLALLFSRGDASLLPTRGNDLDIIPTGTRKWELLLADIEAAQHSICMEYYRWTEDDAGRQIHDALIRKLHQGVQVKILLEDVMNATDQLDFFLNLRREGAQLQFFTDTERQLWEILPDIDIRDHRKIVVIDDIVGYVGGMNLGKKNRDRWLDTHLRIKGPAAESLARLFDDMWESRKGPSLRRQEAKAALAKQGLQQTQTPAATISQSPSDSSHFAPGAFHDKTVQVATSGGGDRLLEQGVCCILREARRYVYFQTPYLCPSDTLLAELRNAARRGVDVRILIPEISDTKLMTAANKAFYGECVDAGVHILASRGTFNHSKTIVADDCISTIGTLNLDNRSLGINHEVIAIVYDNEFALACLDLFLKRAETAYEVTPESIAALPKGKARAMRFWRRYARLL